MRFNSFVVVSVAGVLGLGCVHSYPPPQDLLNARTAVARAGAGPARTLSPARLRLARQALGAAEMSYGAAPEQEVRDRAYVAIRQAEAAEAEAATATSAQRREKVLSELASMGGEKAAQARAQLLAAEQRASDDRLRADSAQQQATAESQRANESQRQATEAKQQLTAEQQARADAEARAQQALAQLQQLGNVRREARGIVVTLSGQVLFATGKSTLLPAAESSLDSVASALKALPPDSPPVIIEGHTDSTGTRGFNLELSERRAQAVRDYLAGKGVSSQRFTVRGLGPDRPVANNTSPEGRANNRRVEIVIPPPTVTEREPSPSTGLHDPLAPTTPAPRPTTTSPTPTAPTPGTLPPSPSTPTNPGPTPPNPNPTPSAPDLPPTPGTTPPARTPASPSDVPPELTPPPNNPSSTGSPPATGPRDPSPAAPGPTPPSRGGPSPKAGPSTPSPVPPSAPRRLSAEPMNFEKLDRARIAAALVAAVITGGAALYGVYSKSREATAASYETLAPEVNDLKSDVEQLRKENQRLREALARSGTRVAPVEAAGAEGRVPMAEGRIGTAEGRAAPRRRRVPTPAPTAGGAADAGAAPPAQPPPAQEPPAAEEPDVIGGLKKRVPIDFEKAIRVWKDVQGIRKKE